MNVLLAAGPESTILFTITVQGCGGSPGRFVGQRRIMVPLHRLQATHRRLILAGDTILSVTRCQPMGDPPPRPHPDPAPDVTASPSPAPVSSASVSPVEETALPPQRVEHVPTPAAHQDQTTGPGASLGEDAMVLLLSVFGVLTLLTLQVAQSLAQQWVQRWGTRAQARSRSDPAAVSVWKRELANLRLSQLLRRASTS